MDNRKKATEIISIITLFGIAIGNSMGLLIGTVLTSDNLGMGLLIGNIFGCVGGLLLGIIIAKLKIKDK